MSSTGPSMSSELQQTNKCKAPQTETFPSGRGSPVLHPRLQVQVSVNRSQPLDDMNTQPLEHLEDRGGRLWREDKRSGPLLSGLRLLSFNTSNNKHNLLRSGGRRKVTCLTIWLGHLMRICMGHQLSSAI